MFGGVGGVAGVGGGVGACCREVPNLSNLPFKGVDLWGVYLGQVLPIC